MLISVAGLEKRRIMYNIKQNNHVDAKISDGLAINELFEKGEGLTYK